MNLNVNFGTGIRGAFNAAMTVVLYLVAVWVAGSLICLLVDAHGNTAIGIHLLVLIIAVFPGSFALLVLIGIGDVRSNAKRKAEILHLLHEPVPAGLRITDEHFGKDQEAAIALDRDTGQFLLWQKQTNRVQVYPVEAIKAIEYCETGSPKKLQLQLELTDVNNPNVSLCLGVWSSRNMNVMLELKAQAIDWKALLEARHGGLQGLKGDSTSSQDSKDLRLRVKRSNISGSFSVLGGIGILVAHSINPAIPGGVFGFLVGFFIVYIIGHLIARVFVPASKAEAGYGTRGG